MIGAFTWSSISLEVTLTTMKNQRSQIDRTKCARKERLLA